MFATNREGKGKGKGVKVLKRQGPSTPLRSG